VSLSPALPLLDEIDVRRVDVAPIDCRTALAAPVTASDPRLRIDRIIALIDELLTEQVNAVIHHPRFQALEASWRSLRRLVWTGSANSRIKIRVLDLRWAELCRDLERTIEFDQSHLFRKIYEEEFGMPGGEPFGLLIGDYHIVHRRSPSRSTDDVAAIREMSRIAAAAFAPFIIGITPEFFGLDSFAELCLPLDLPAVFQLPEYLRWRSFQDTEDSRFVGLVLPRILARQTYRDDDSRVDGFRFDEECGAHDQLLWGSGAYAFAGVVMRAFAESGWFSHIRGGILGVEEGGLVPELEIPSFETDRKGVATIFPAEVTIEDRQEAELGELGFIPMVRANGTSLAMFCGNASAQRAKSYDRLAATVNARLSSMLQYILCVCRFAHYVKVIGRETIGSVKSAAEVEQRLQSWISQFVNVNEHASLATMAQHPLREARIEIKELPGKPGTYYCTASLKPHFQLERVETSFRLVTELAAAG
jgi:type VI secretion system protein ImpD